MRCFLLFRITLNFSNEALSELMQSCSTRMEATFVILDPQLEFVDLHDGLPTLAKKLIPSGFQIVEVWDDLTIFRLHEIMYLEAIHARLKFWHGRVNHWGLRLHRSSCIS